jgi:hypothetical protein
MFWCRAKFTGVATLLCGITVAACWSACRPDVKESGSSLKYFDINGYFTRDIARLNKLNKPVLKTVTHNTVSESKTVKINNWELELSLFKEADINRPAWKNSYTVIDEDGLVIYRAKYPELKMREMLIKKDKEKIKWILIYNKTPKNILYQTTEKLSYFPDSIYVIDKVQRVRLMGSNFYEIKGVIGR